MAEVSGHEKAGAPDKVASAFLFVCVGCQVGMRFAARSK